MYVNKCIKCGREFETKNPKRVICPECLYPDKNMMINNDSPKPMSNTDVQPQVNEGFETKPQEEVPRYYSAGGSDEQNPRYSRPRPSYDNRDRNNRGGGYGQRPQGGNRYQNNNNRGGHSQRPQGGGRYQNNNNRGGYGQRPQGGGRFPNNRKSMNRNKAPKQLLVSKDQLAQIELLYKMMMPLPNPDAHEVIAEKIGIEPRKVFFGINLIRQKMMLPKLTFPKRKLAISADQLFAIKNLYGLLLPLPPIGCHKIIAAQLKMDEWRVHVGIGLIRSQMGLPRWNEERTDVPETLIEKTRLANEAKAKKEAEKAQVAAAKAATEEQTDEVASIEEAVVQVDSETVEEKPKRGRKPKTDE